jgi:large subunit ribosomal protein L6
MSRIGKQPIEIPQGVTVDVKDNLVTTKGPKGELKVQCRPEVDIKIEDNNIVVAIKDDAHRAYWGLTRSLIANNVEGVTKGFTKQLEIQGVGYRAKLEGKKIILEMGFSHNVPMDIPEGIEIIIEKNIVTINGIDKQLVGETAATIRAVKKPEPYKGKGIRYVGEEVRRKAGKRAAE